MNWKRIILAAAIAGRLAAGAAAQSGFYPIGNSLTWDTIPTEIPGDVQYHVDCGVGLDYIYQNPESPCVGTSTIWTTALAAKQYSVLAFQPHGNDAFETVVARIKAWADSQTGAATLVIHTSWAGHADHVAEYVDPSTATVKKSAAFMDALQARLETEYPSRTIRQTYTHAMLYDIAQDIAAETAPAELTALSDLYRDDIHLSAGSGNDGAGRYLAHNAMRRTLGLPYAEPSSCTASAELKAYLRQQIETYHPQIQTSGSFQ